MGKWEERVVIGGLQKANALGNVVELHVPLCILEIFVVNLGASEEPVGTRGTAQEGIDAGSPDAAEMKSTERVKPVIKGRWEIGDWGPKINLTCRDR